MTADSAAPHHTSPTDWIWLSLPYALLLAIGAHALATGAVSSGDAPRTIATGVVLALWHTFWAVLNRQWLERSLAPMAVYFAGLLALCTLLLQTSFSFFALYLVCYPMAFVALPGAWAYVGLTVATLVPLIVPGALQGSGLNLAITGAGLALATFIGWSIRRLEAETAARRAALLDLAAAHTDLERALAENLALQDRLVTEAHEAGVHAERARLAAEIHDTLAAALTGIVSQLEALDAEVSAGDPVRRRLRTSTDLARESLLEARHSIQALRPTALHGRSLTRALAEITSASERTHGLPVQWQVTGTPLELDAETEHTLIRLAREALSNVGRHAAAAQVHLTLSYLGDAVALDVADDGVGFDPDSSPAGGYGLEIMSERTQALGGHLELSTSPGTGTTLTATIPFPRSRPLPAALATEGADEHR